VRDDDLALRRETYRLLVDLGRAPTAEEAAAATRRPAAEVLAAWRRLHDAHALVLDESGTAIRMANPFSAVPTPYRVEAGGRWWFANCAWDAFGICAALGTDGRLETSCPDCREDIALDVRETQPSDRSLVFHCLVPARDWWQDIGFT